MSDDIKIWNLFCQSYNTDYLDQLSQNGKTRLIKLLSQNKYKFEGLVRIINNHFSFKSINHINRLINVLSLNYFTSEKYNKRIYIFGEQHTTNNTCSVKNTVTSNVYDFINKNIKFSDKFIDIFIELAYVPKNYFKNNKYKKKENLDSTLRKFEDKYKNCLYLKRNCQYPNVRFHYTDVRLTDFLENKSFYINLSENIIGLYYNIEYGDLLYYQSTLLNLRELLNNNIYKKERNKFLKCMNSNNVDNVIKYLSEIYKHTKIDKQQEKIKDDHVKSVLMEYLRSFISNIKFDFIGKNIQKIINSLPYKKKPDIKQLNEFNKLRAEQEDLDVPFMDIYLMARVFRKFKQIKYQNSKEPENIIIYVGDYHAQNYSNILKTLNFKNEFSISRVDNNNCIDISKLKQPLFS